MRCDISVKQLIMDSLSNAYNICALTLRSHIRQTNVADLRSKEVLIPLYRAKLAFCFR